MNKPKLTLQTTTLWEYPSQHYGTKMQGDKTYQGATPSYLIWNLLERYTREGDKVLDPFCGSGTLIEVAHDLKREPLGFDLVPYRADIKQSDARHLPLKNESVDFVFMDPPYSTHIEYSDHPHCIGKLDSREPAYFEAMDAAIKESVRVLKDRRFFALYIADSFKKGKPFSALGFEMYAILRKYLKPVDIIAVVRHNKTLKRNHWHTSAIEGNYFLRGFNYLLIFKKEKAGLSS